ncbi:hypothetical protein BYT27DRAFT_7247194 [Phlegmacium glaucopus]|nr:hypothetical protein BYT27DRAFT_7247194 [Phlegmacium glaucopus]
MTSSAFREVIQWLLPWPLYRVVQIPRSLVPLLDDHRMNTLGRIQGEKRNTAPKPAFITPPRVEPEPIASTTFPVASTNASKETIKMFVYLASGVRSRRHMERHNPRPPSPCNHPVTPHECHDDTPPPRHFLASKLCACGKKIGPESPLFS